MHHEHHHHHHEHSHDHATMEELLALMKYMTGHNEAHARELAELAHRLAHAGGEAAYEKIMSAVHDFHTGNEKLAQVLKEFQEA